VSIVPSLARLAPFQLGFVVRDLERAVQEFDETLGAGPWRGWLFGPQGQGREYKSQPAEWTLRLALNDRSPQYELIEPQQGPSIHADWLAERGEGFHHLGYVVPSLERTTAEMEAAGHPVVARIHSFGRAGDGAAAYYDTAEALGFLIEAVEPPSEMPPADFML
jgi:catechol 2,3-dioxygenase-like lactoylglutathione lyase family enzyme